MSPSIWTGALWMVTKWGVSGTKMSYMHVMVGLSKLDRVCYNSLKKWCVYIMKISFNNQSDVFTFNLYGVHFQLWQSGGSWAKHIRSWFVSLTVGWLHLDSAVTKDWRSKSVYIEMVSFMSQLEVHSFTLISHHTWLVTWHRLTNEERCIWELSSNCV